MTPKQNHRSNNNYTFIEIVALAGIVVLVWFWINNKVLSAYTLQLTAFLVIVYFLARFFFNRKNASIHSSFLLDIIFFTAILLLLLSSTGGLSSPLFFLIYFLLFATALLLETPSTFSLTLVLILFFVQSTNTLHAVLQLLSLVLITPLAIFFGRQYLRLLEAQEKIKILRLDKKFLFKESQKLKGSIQTEETNSLLWLTLNFKNGLLKIIHLTSELLSELSQLNLTQKERLQIIHETAKEVLKSGEKLKEKIDRETDK